MRPTRLLVVLALALGLGACGTDVPYYGYVPYYAGTSVPPYGYCYDPTCGGYYYLTAASAPAPATITASCDAADAFCRLETAGVAVNYYLKATLGAAEEVAAAGGGTSGDTATYGPKDVVPPGGSTAAATFRLIVKRRTDTTYAFRLDAKPVGAADSAYRAVAVGNMTRGTVNNRGRGAFGIDLDALAAANATVFTGKGRLLAAFASDAQQKAMAFGFDGFQATATSPLVSNTVLVAHLTSDGHSRLRVAAAGEFVPPPGGGTDTSLELAFLRGTWARGLGGRAAILVTGGDVPSYGEPYLLQLACYDAARTMVYGDLFECSALSAGACAAVPSPPAGFRAGSPSACVAGTELYDASSPPPATVEASPTQEPGAPFDPGAPPTAIPSF